MRLWRLMPALVLWLLGAEVAGAQSAIIGIVRDSTGKILVGAEVQLDSSPTRLRTDSAGAFRLVASPGRHEVLFRMLGYRPQLWRATLAAGETLELDVALAPGNAQTLETVDVKALRPRGLGIEGFEERRALGLGGKFIDSLALRKADGRHLSEVLREYGVCMYVTKDPRHEQYAMITSRCHPMTAAGERLCPMTVILDRVTLYRSGSSMPIPDFSRDFYIPNFAAIEVYTRASQMPMEFAGRMDCGVIVLWTRRG